MLWYSETPEILHDAVEVIKGQLYWYCHRTQPSEKDHPNLKVLNYDNKWVYKPFAAEFGPLNIGQLTEYLREISQEVKNQNMHHGRVVDKRTII